MVFEIGRPLATLTLIALVSGCAGGPGVSSTPGSALSDASAASPAASDAESLHAAMAELDSAPDAGTPVRAVFHALPIRPDGKVLLPWIMGFVAAGEAQGGVPCISCVNGAQTGDNVGLTGPGNYVPAGATWQYSIAYTNVAFKGTCKLAWAIASGAKKVDAFAATVNLTQTGGFVLYALNRNRPKFSGKAVLAGRVTCGKGAAQTSTAPLVFQ